MQNLNIPQNLGLVSKIFAKLNKFSRTDLDIPIFLKRPKGVNDRHSFTYARLNNTYHLPFELSFKSLFFDQKFKENSVADSSGFALKVLERCKNNLNPRGVIISLDIAGMKSINNAGNGDLAISKLIETMQYCIDNSVLKDKIELGRIRGDMFMLFIDIQNSDESVDELLKNIERKSSELEVEHKSVLENGELKSERKGVGLHVDKFKDLNDRRFANLVNSLLKTGFIPDDEILDYLGVDAKFTEIFPDIPRETILKKILVYVNKIPSVSKIRFKILSLNNIQLQKILFVLEKRYSVNEFPICPIMSENEFIENIEQYSFVGSVDFNHMKYLNERGDSYGDLAINQVWSHLNSILTKPIYKPLIPHLVFSKHYYKPMFGIKNSIQNSGRDRELEQLFHFLLHDINSSTFEFQSFYSEADSIFIPISTSVTPINTQEQGKTNIENAFFEAEMQMFENYILNESIFKILVEVFSSPLDPNNFSQQVTEFTNTRAWQNYFFNPSLRGPKHIQDFFQFLLSSFWDLYKNAQNLKPFNFQNYPKKDRIFLNNSYYILKLGFSNHSIYNSLTPDQKQIGQIIFSKVENLDIVIPPSQSYTGANQLV
jgi:GGDEF domain-containing protein